MKRTRRRLVEMYPLIEANFAGGQTQPVFCTERDLAAPVLGYWLRVTDEEDVRHRDTEAGTLPLRRAL